MSLEKRHIPVDRYAVANYCKRFEIGFRIEPETRDAPSGGGEVGKEIPDFGGACRLRNNIGAPVVSYYSNEALIDMLERNEDCVIETKRFDRERVTPVMRLGLITRRMDTTIVARKIT